MARAFRDNDRTTTRSTSPTRPHTGSSAAARRSTSCRDCAFDFEIRHLPFDDPDELFAEVKNYAERFVPEMRRVAADTHIEFDALSTSPGFDTRGESAIAELSRQCTGADGHGKVSFGTEAALFHGAAIPAIICGPGHIAQAHQPNEWVTVEQLAQCESFMRRLADRICAS
jgi:acetylornithine deacetylase